MSVVLEAKNLKKRFGGNEAVRDVSFTVSAGECVCLAGDNGAGAFLAENIGIGTPGPLECELHGFGQTFGDGAEEAVTGIDKFVLRKFRVGIGELCGRGLDQARKARRHQRGSGGARYEEPA